MGEYKYYTDEFQRYAKELTGIDGVKKYANTLTDSVNRASLMTDKLTNDLSELSGMTIDQLKETVAGETLSYFEQVKNSINEQLLPTIGVCERLASGLEELKSTEDDLIAKEDSKATLTKNPVGRGTYDEKEKKYSNQTAYDEYMGKLKVLNEAIPPLISACEALKDADDTDVNTIKQFNAALEDFTAALFSFSITMGNTDFEGFSNMRYEKKMEILNGLINDLTERYNELKVNLESTKRETTLALLTALGCPITRPGWPLDFESMYYVYSFLSKDYNINGKSKSGIEIINDYFNGQDWETSGMGLLAITFNNFSMERATNPDSGEILELMDGERILTNGAKSESEFWKNFIFALEEYDPEAASELFYNSDYYKEYGGDPSVSGFRELLDSGELYNTKFLDEDGKSHILYTKLIASLKKEFVDSKRLDAVNQYYKQLDDTITEYGYDTFPVLDALGAVPDWDDPKAVIPADVITRYLNGEGWEESGLAKYANKSEEEFIYDLATKYNKTYRIPELDEYEYDADGHKILSLEQETAGSFNLCSIDDDELKRKIENGEDISEYIKEIKESLVENGCADNISTYYKSVNDRNDLIAAQQEELLTTGETIRGLKEIRTEAKYIDMKSKDWYKRAMDSEYTFDEPPDDLDLGIWDGYDYNDLYKRMTKEERVIFNRLYNYSSKSEGRQYIQDLADKINRRTGKEQAATYVKSVRDDNVMTQEEYAQKYAKEHNCDIEYAREQTTEKLRSDYEQMLIKKYHYNPECARIAAEEYDFSNKKILGGTEVGDIVVTGLDGLGMGLNDLGVNLWHNISPEMVKSANNYKAQYIVEMFNDETSDYYDPILAGTYSGSRTIGHKGPALVLKAIPTKTTKLIGNAIDYLDRSGEMTNKTFQETGGNMLSAALYTHGSGLVEHLASKATAGISIEGLGAQGNAFVQQTTKGLLSGTGKTALRRVFVDPNMDMGDAMIDVTVDSVNKGLNASIMAGVKVDTGYKPADKLITQEIAGQVGIFTGSGSQLAKDILKGEDADMSKYGKMILSGEQSKLSAESWASRGLTLTTSAISDGVDKHQRKEALEEAVRLGIAEKDQYGDYHLGDISGTQKEVASQMDYGKIVKINQVYNSADKLVEAGTVTQTPDGYYMGGVKIGDTHEDLVGFYLKNRTIFSEDGMVLPKKYN